MPEAGRTPLEAAVVRLWRHDSPVGAGALVGPRHVLTAAHVVASAVGAAPSGAAPDDLVEVDFPLLTPGHRQRARVVAWQPLRDDRTGDVAGLELLDDPPPRARPLVLATGHGPAGNQLLMIGFPHRLELGSWVYGRPGGPVATGWVEIHSEPGRESTLEPGFSGTPVWDPDAHAAVGMVVQQVTGAPPKMGYMLPADRLLAGWPELAGLIERTPPFRGLRPFTEQDSALFFGREDLVDRLVRHATEMPVVCVIGPSGVGKSSLLLAGVLPRLRAAGTLVAVLRPSDAGSPLAALALAIDRLLAPRRDPLERVDAVAALTGRFVRGELPDVVSALTTDPDGTARRLVIAVDQFEELFASPAADRAALTSALRVTLRPGSRTGLLLNLRDTFLGASLRTPEVTELAAAWLAVTVGDMSLEQLRRVVTGPLAGAGVDYEPGLVDRILADVQSSPGALPLLQFALTELWDRHTGGLLTHAVYDDMKGVRGALAGYAESVWTGLEPGAREAGERLLVQLVRPLPDDRLIVRRTAQRDELDEAQWTVAQRLATSRLLVLRAAAPGPGVELAHESLLTGWERLGRLAEQHREFRIWQETLRQQRARWVAEQHAARRLLSGADLRDAKRRADRHPADLSAAEHAYVTASLRRRRRRALLAGGVVVVLALFIGLTYRGTGQQRSELAARDLATAANRLSGLDSYGAAQLAMRAERTDDDADLGVAWPGGLDGVDRLVPDYSFVERDTSAPVPSAGPAAPRWAPQVTTTLTSRISADGSAMVTLDPARHVALWHLSGGVVTRDPALDKLFGPTDFVQDATISRDGRYVGYTAKLFATVPSDPFAPAGPDGLPRPVPRAQPTCPVPSITSIVGCLVAYDTVAHRVVYQRAFSQLVLPVTALSFDPGARTMAYVVSSGTELSSPHTVVNTLHKVDLSTRAESPARVLPWHSWVPALWLGPGGGQALVTEFLPLHEQTSYGRIALSRIDLTTAIPVRHELLDQTYNLDVSLDWSTVTALVPTGDHVTAVVLRSWSGGPITRVSDLTDAEQDGSPTLNADGSALVIVPSPKDFLQASANDVTQLADQPRPPLSAWTLPSGARQATGSGGFTDFSVDTAWQALLPLSRDPLGPVLVLHNSTVGVAFGPASLRRLSDAAKSSGSGSVSADRLCALMADPANDQAVRDLVPKDAYQGALCPS
ncbi:serine protease [Actinoplanes sp. TBRC 11911]|uniref:serine protease n=1 Tax=Actinoplanes sp. TBRC 11911 TaxID=2729386 RepID=UPI00145E4E7C|nr:serine protease [Actinoplanes sp. TBRC 11911]NMO49952.1 serine protease [Actinoplanes sp. TBRC 11911]